MNSPFPEGSLHGRFLRWLAPSESNEKGAWGTRQSLALVNVSHEESGELFKPSEISTVLADLSEVCNLLTLHRRLHLQMCWDS